MSIFGKPSGYRWMDVYILANIVELGTDRFCDDFLNFKNDPGGRTFGQMNHAARSGCRNLAEGSERLTTSSASGIDLINVALASLCELRDDYNKWLMKHGQAPWAMADAEAQKILATRLDPADYGEDVNRGCCLHILKQLAKFDPWLKHETSLVRANALLLLLTRTLTMMHGYKNRLGEEFASQGGFKERMSEVRSEARVKSALGAEGETPKCPVCGGAMRLRKTKADNRAFWGCGDYPLCKGVVECRKKA